jgi:hypothetical protein
MNIVFSFLDKVDFINFATLLFIFQFIGCLYILMGLGAKEDAYLWQLATCINVILYQMHCEIERNF